MTSLYRSSLSDEARRRPTREVEAVLIEVDTPTMRPPAKVCTCCKGSVTHEEWMTNGSRRPWADLGLEIAEHGCKSTLAKPINRAPVVLTENGR